jgi:N-succinyldiaminopimelate aminotransferase
VQAASLEAWDDEDHVVANRAEYRAKFAAVTPVLSAVMDVQLPDAAFYLWAGVPSHVCNGSDTQFAAELLAKYNVTVLPGSYLARENASGVNPGLGRVRMALVAEQAECLEAAHRIAEFITTYK